jgi:hypothetical protein
MREKPTNTQITHSVDLLLVINYLFICLVAWCMAIAQISTHYATRHNTPIHNILSTAPQLSISQKALGTLPEDGNIMLKHVGAATHN